MRRTLVTPGSRTEATCLPASPLPSPTRPAPTVSPLSACPGSQAGGQAGGGALGLSSAGWGTRGFSVRDCRCLHALLPEQGRQDTVVVCDGRPGSQAAVMVAEATVSCPSSAPRWRHLCKQPCSEQRAAPAAPGSSLFPSREPGVRPRGLGGPPSERAGHCRALASGGGASPAPSAKSPTLEQRPRGARPCPAAPAGPSPVRLEAHITCPFPRRKRTLPNEAYHRLWVKTPCQASKGRPHGAGGAGMVPGGHAGPLSFETTRQRSESA